MPKETTEVLKGTTSIRLKEGRPASTVYAILTPWYITTVGRSPQFELKHLQRQFRKMLDTLTYIHGCNIVHLDVKGDNIFVGGDGESARIYQAPQHSSTTQSLPTGKLSWGMISLCCW